MIRNILLLLVVALVSTGCAKQMDPKDYSLFRQSDPRSILIVPVINHSAEVEASDLFLSTLPVPLAERGFYVFPVNLTKNLMEQDGLGDPYLVHKADTIQLASLFGADSVLYVEILDWKSQYALTSANIVVGFVYTLKDGRTGELLWQEQESMVYAQSSSGGGILGQIIAAAIVSAIDNTRSDYTPVAVQANSTALLLDGQGIPFGPYSPNYRKDDTAFPSSGTGRKSDATIEAVAYPVSPPDRGAE